MLRKASLARALRLGGAAAAASAAWLGLALILADDNPVATLGVLAALVAVAGGWAARASGRPVFARALACLVPVVLVRVVGGTLAAALAAGCAAAGWGLQVRLRDALLVLAFFGGAIAVVSSPSWRLILAFVVLGTLTVAARPLFGVGRRGLRRLLVLGVVGRPRRPSPLNESATLRSSLEPEMPRDESQTVAALEVNR